MLPARPRITLLAPRQILPGATALLTVQLDTPRATPIDYVDLFIVGQAWTQLGHQELLRLGARLRGPGRLTKGRTELECRVDVPGSAPPSYEGATLRVRHEARVDVSVPYWPDAHGAYQLVVRPPPRASTLDDARLFSSASGGAPVKGPYAELSLDARSVAPGDVLSGAVALYNVAQCRYDRVTVTVQQSEHAATVTPGPAWSIEIAPTRFEEGRPVPFALRIPATTPSMQVRHVAVKHELIVVAHSGWRELVRMPIPIDLVPDPVRDEQRTRSVPALGEDRVRAIWERVATLEGMALENDELVGRDGGLTLTVRRDHVKGAPLLLAEVKHPTLGLMLRSSPRSRFRIALGGSPRSGLAAIDDALAFEARSIAQASDWLTRFAPRLAPLLARPLVIHEVSDTHTALAAADSGTTEGAIIAMVRAGKALAALLIDLVPTVAAPPGLPDEAWSALARRLGASLERGTGLLSLEDADARISVRPLFDDEGAVHAVRIARQEPSALEVATPVTASSAEALGWLRDEARAAASTLVERGVELHLAPDEIALTATLGVHWQADEVAPRTEQALGGLSRLASALRPARGPFR